MQTTWEVWTYDVWVNAEDGFEGNDRFCQDREFPINCEVQTHNRGTEREFQSAGPSDEQVREALGIKPGWPIETDGDDLMIYVNSAEDGYPLGELLCTSHESLSPVRKVTSGTEPGTD